MSISGHKIYGPKGKFSFIKNFPLIFLFLCYQYFCTCLDFSLTSVLKAWLILWTGVGALYVRKRPRVRLEPSINGGGQERGLRSGTVPSPLVVGLGAACAIAKQEMQVSMQTNHVTPGILNAPISSFCPLDTTMVLTSDNFLSISLHPFLFPSGSLKLSRGAIFTACSHIFILFWLTKLSVRVKTYQLNLFVFSSRDLFIF